MRNILFTLSLILIASTSLLHAQEDGYLIKGKINAWKDSSCYFGNHYGDKKYVKDTAKIDKNGNFVFKGKEKLPGGIYIIVFPNKLYYELLIDKEQHFSLETDTADMAKNMKIKGSEDNILFYKYLNFIASEQTKADPMRKRIAKLREDTLAAKTTKKDSIKLLQEKLSAIDKEVDTYQLDFIKDHPASFLSVVLKSQKDPVIPETPTLPNGRKDSTFPYRYYKAHYWDNLSLSDDRLLRTPMFHMKLKGYFDNVIAHDPDSIIKEADILVARTNGNKETFKYVVWYVTTTYETSPIMGMDAVFVHEVEQYYMTKKAFWVDSVQNVKIIHRALIVRPLLLGKPAPPVILQDTLGANISLYEVKSKYTILIFWDPDCGHCQKIVPKLKELYDKSLKAKGVTVYAVESEEKDAKWKKFIIEHKLDWINVHDKFNQYFFHDMYDIYSTPVIYILDENKKIKAKRIDAEQIDAFIDHLKKTRELDKKK